MNNNINADQAQRGLHWCFKGVGSVWYAYYVVMFVGIYRPNVQENSDNKPHQTGSVRPPLSPSPHFWYFIVNNKKVVNSCSTPITNGPY